MKIVLWFSYSFFILTCCFAFFWPIQNKYDYTELQLNFVGLDLQQVLFLRACGDNSITS